jgi:hypothetical protein
VGRNKAIEVIAVLVFLVPLGVVILPLAGQFLADGFRRVVEGTPS